MTSKSRRGFLRSAAQLAAASAAMGAVPEGIRQALAIPAHTAHRNIEDVQHIVIAHDHATVRQERVAPTGRWRGG